VWSARFSALPTSPHSATCGVGQLPRVRRYVTTLARRDQGKAPDVKREVLTWIALNIVLLTTLAAPVRVEASSKAGPSVAPSFTLQTSAGTVSLDSLDAKVILVDFWASWCVPCKASFPWMSAMHERYGSKGLSIVAINVDKSRKAADDFLVKHPAPFTIAYDPSGKTAKAFHVWGMPTSFLIGPGRAILFSRAGFDPKHAKEVEAMIEAACTR